jgi:hypothetical protein
MPSASPTKVLEIIKTFFAMLTSMLVIARPQCVSSSIMTVRAQRAEEKNGVQGLWGVRNTIDDIDDTRLRGGQRTVQRPVCN